MAHEESSFPTDRTDAAIALASVLVSAVPWLGGPVSNIVSGYSQTRKFDRVQELLDGLARRLSDFESDLAKEYVRTEDFEELLEQTLRRAADERDAEVRNLYLRFIQRATTEPGDEYDAQMDVLGAIERLRHRDITILQALCEERSSQAEYVNVVARDDAGGVSDVDVLVPGRSTVHFNNHDLEEGNPSKEIHYGGISGTTDGMWNLCIQSQTVQATGYVRTSDGFLMEATLPVQGHGESPCFTSSHGAALCTKWVIPIFNPGYNREQVSMLKLLNNTAVDKAVEIRGLRSDATRNMDDDGEALRILFTLKSSQGVYLTREELESGGNYLRGKLTPIVNDKMVALPLGSIERARGKWLIEIWAKADAPQEVVVMNLLHAKPTGHIANLSANADDAVTRRKDYDERD